MCGRHFGNFSLFDRPALLSPEGNIVECEAVRPEAIPDVLYTHKPVCWDCKGTERLVWALGSGRATASAPVESQMMPGMEVMIRWQHTAVLRMVALLGVSLCSPGNIGREPRDIPHVDRAEPDVVQTGDVVTAFGKHLDWSHVADVLLS